MRLYCQLILVSLKTQLQYRSSLFMLTGSYFLSTFIDIIGIWILMDRFQMIQGWSLPELCVLYGIMQMGFSLAETFARGFDTLGHQIKQGDFDRILLKPLSPFLQVAASDVQLMRLGRFFQGLIVLLWGISQLPIELLSLHTLVAFFSIIGTALLFYSLFVLQGALSFWTIETLELMNIITFGGLEVGQYPLSIYSFWLKRFFTFIIPLASVAYYPADAWFHQGNASLWIALSSPLAGALFFLFSYYAFTKGIARYQSTGS